MKLLVLAQTPPPLHGQSLMVQTAVEGLPEHGIEVHHVNLRLSRSHADIGGWRIGKMLAVLDACFHTIVTRFVHDCDTLYYVPAPAKRGALYRDWMVMALCRPFFRKLVLHFHNGGLGDWVRERLTAPERALTRLLLGRADLAIVLTDSLRGDAEALGARKIAGVPNGIADPGRPQVRPAATEDFVVLFLGGCGEDKGLFVALDAISAANRAGGAARFRLVAAGAFADQATAKRFRAHAAVTSGAARHAGFVRGEALERLWREASCLCLPSHYAHEAQPLVLIEAMARGVPIVASRWRGISETVAAASATLVPPSDSDAVRDALLALQAAQPSGQESRRIYEERFTLEAHIQALRRALTTI